MSDEKFEKMVDVVLKYRPKKAEKPKSVSAGNNNETTKKNTKKTTKAS